MKERVTVEKFQELFETRDTVAAEWRKTGKKIVGCISTYTPEEIIYSAEALPMMCYDLKVIQSPERGTSLG